MYLLFEEKFAILKICDTHIPTKQKIFKSKHYAN